MLPFHSTVVGVGVGVGFQAGALLILCLSFFQFGILGLFCDVDDIYD